MQTVKVPTNDGYLYTEYDGSGKPIIFVHGEVYDRIYWVKQLEYFQSNYETINYDQRGYGFSPLPNIGVKWSNESDLNYLYDYSDLDGTVIIAHSLGAHTAINFAVMNPEKVNALVLISPLLNKFSSYSEYAEDIIQLAKASRKQSLDITRKSWLSNLLKHTEVDLNTYKYIVSIISKNSFFSWTTNNFSMPVDFNLKPKLQEMKLPVLIINGENDIDVNKEVSVYLKSNLSNHKKIMVPKAGHFSNIEQSEILNKEIDTFLSQISY